MKILLDESLPRKLRFEFGTAHQVLTARDKDWLSKKNGELLKLMAKDNFDIFVTVDQNLRYQQNLESFSLTIVVLIAKNNRLQTLRLLISRVLEIISAGSLKKIIEIL